VENEGRWGRRASPCLARVDSESGIGLASGEMNSPSRSRWTMAALVVAAFVLVAGTTLGAALHHGHHGPLDRHCLACQLLDWTAAPGVELLAGFPSPDAREFELACLTIAPGPQEPRTVSERGPPTSA
jgi:hypothetical protein